MSVRPRTGLPSGQGSDGPYAHSRIAGNIHDRVRAPALGRGDSSPTAVPGAPEVSAEIVPYGMPEKGEEIVVLVRYRGQEFTMTHGTVETVRIDRDVQQEGWDSGSIGKVVLAGTETLTVVVRR
jgi:hypothetical protein